jgi:SAM-dependent methyltransferase
MHLLPPQNCPDRQQALEQYRLRAKVYDHELLAFEPIRHRAIARLNLAPGATVLDVGCGTGLSFEPLELAIGPAGHIIAIEQCPEMMELARARVAQHGWRNVSLLSAPMETARIQPQADAALFHFTHDILRNPEAISHVVQGLKCGAHTVAAGLQWSNPWAWTTNWLVLMAAMYSVTSLDGLDRPWSHLAEYLDDLEISLELMGSVYIASGVVTARRQRRLAIDS